MGLLVEDYRPHTVEDCILPDRIKKIFKEFVKKGEVNNMVLKGSPGTGKTTLAKALCDELDIDYLVINSGKDADISLLRTQVTNFASSMSLVHGGKIKVVIFDEADTLSRKVQKGLLPMIEEFANNCRFIFTVNHANMLLEPIHSRCATVSFTFTENEAQGMMKQFALRCFDILDKENIEYDKKAVVEFVKKVYPDMRKILVELQSYSMNGKIDSGILTTNVLKSRLQELFVLMKSKKWKEMRNWCGENVDLLDSSIYTELYDVIDDYLIPSTLPIAVELIGDAMRYDSFVPDRELHIAALLTSMLQEVECK